MQAGKLRHRVTIQQKTTTQDPEGMTTETWTNVATVWAAVEPLKGREYFQAQAVNAEVTTRVRIRYRAGIIPTMRVLFGARKFDILAVIDQEERHQELQLMCREVVAGGGAV